MAQTGRIEPRVDIADNAVVVTLRSRAEFLRAYARNISRGGLFVPTGAPLAVGTRVQFEVHFEPDEPPFAGIGEVVWVRRAGAGGRDGMGIKFVHLAGGSKELAARILALLDRYGEQIGADADRGDAPPKVLIVDDSEFMRNWAAHVLKAAGFAVLTADHVWVGPVIARERPDVVLMDVGMGREDGAVATRDLKQVLPDAPTRILLYSVKPQDELERLAAAVGADGALHKSEDPRELVDRVRAALGVG